MTEYKTVRDGRAEEPLAVDATTSAFVVYERTNIRRETFKDEMGGEITEWVYEQRELTREEYADMNSPTTQIVMQAISNLELSIAMVGLE